MSRISRALSGYHLTAAIHNCREAGVIEEGVEGKDLNEVFRNERVGRWQPIHDAHIITCFSEAFASVETQINEFVAHQEDSGQASALIANYPGQFTRKSTLEKYQVVLSANGNQVFATGEEPYQSVDILRKMRNYFEHHSLTKVDLDEIGEEPSHRIAKALQTKDISFYHPFLPEDHEYFPGRSMNYSVGRWAIDVAIRFENAFRDRMGTTPVFADERELNELETDWRQMDPQW